jgi:hypothetical protein
MPDGDTGLAQAIYLANMFAQRGSCQCKACQLLRQSTDGMISQVLGKGSTDNPIPGADALKQAMAMGRAVDPLGQEVG